MWPSHPFHQCKYREPKERKGTEEYLSCIRRIRGLHASPTCHVVRTKHAVVGTYDDRMVVVGGYDQRFDTFLNDVLEFTVADGTWRQVFPHNEQAAPAPRRAHSAGIVQGRYAVLFGGLGEEGCFGDVACLDTEGGMSWVSVAPEPGTGRTAPSPRGGHSCAVSPHSLYIYGGWDVTHQLHNDLWSLSFSPSTATYRWAHVEATGCAPAGRVGHTSCFYGGEVFVFGGYTTHGYDNKLYAVRPEDGVWREVEVEAGGSPWAAPSPRTFSCMQVAPSGKLIVIGGSDADEIKSDVWMTDISEGKVRWQQLPFRAEKVFAHASIRVQGRIIVFGTAEGRTDLLEFTVEDWEPRNASLAHFARRFLSKHLACYSAQQLARELPRGVARSFLAYHASLPLIPAPCRHGGPSKPPHQSTCSTPRTHLTHTPSSTPLFS